MPDENIRIIEVGGVKVEVDLRTSKRCVNAMRGVADPAAFVLEAQQTKGRIDRTENYISFLEVTLKDFVATIKSLECQLSAERKHADELAEALRWSNQIIESNIPEGTCTAYRQHQILISRHDALRRDGAK